MKEEGEGGEEEERGRRWEREEGKEEKGRGEKEEERKTERYVYKNIVPSIDAEKIISFGFIDI